jgi:hypothetical protein
MEVYALAFYLCTTVMASDISERVCSWQVGDYYDNPAECVFNIRMIKRDLEDDNNEITEATCTPATVL